MGYRKHGFRLRLNFYKITLNYLVFTLKQSTNTLCFDSDVYPHSLKLGDRGFSSNRSQGAGTNRVEYILLKIATRGSRCGFSLCNVGQAVDRCFIRSREDEMLSFIRNAEIGHWVLFSRSVSFDGPFFTLKSGSVTECNLRGRCKKGRGFGMGVKR